MAPSLIGLRAGLAVDRVLDLIATLQEKALEERSDLAVILDDEDTGAVRHTNSCPRDRSRPPSRPGSSPG